VAVLELGISERGDMEELAGAVQPDVAVVTSIAAAHTLGLGGVDGVREQKARIVRSSVRALTIPASKTHHAVWHERRPEGAELVTVGDGPAANVQVARAGAFGTVTLRGAIPEDLHGPLALPGDAMARNLALALVGVTRLVGETSVGTLSSVRAAMERVDLPGGRLERRVCGERTILDDSYNANPASVRAGLEVLASMPSPRIAVLGEMRELEGDLSAAHAEVGSWVDGRADVLVTVGELAGCAARATAPSVEVVTCRDVAEAVSWFRSEAPASASIWVKGSRAAALDRLVHALVARTAEES
jgi:UDP-N-acetylmuramoyl-tripeptide--D-alanyl-D-alanine ligase